MSEKQKKDLKQISLRIARSDKLVKEQKVNFVIVPACDGDIGIKASHAPFLACLRQGKVIITISQDEEKEEIDVESGFVEVLESRVTILLS